MNPILESVLKARNGHYCHAIVVECEHSLKTVIESLYEEFNNEYSFDDVSEFITTMEIYHNESNELSDEENEERSTLIYDFNIQDYLNELHGV